MMYNVLDARNNLSKLVAEAESGIEVTIARRGVPVAKIVPLDYAPPRPRNVFAQWLEANPLTPDVSRPLEEIDAIVEENRSAGA